MDNKPGFKSTEFWLTLLMILLVAFNKKLGLDLDIEAVIGIATMSGIYSVARSAPKTVAVLKGTGDGT